MYYVLLDSTGNLIASYRDEDDARLALQQLVGDDPEAAEDIALMTYDDEGTLADDPVFVVPAVAVATVHTDDPLKRWYSEWSPGFEASQTRQIAEPVG